MSWVPVLGTGEWDTTLSSTVFLGCCREEAQQSLGEAGGVSAVPWRCWRVVVHPGLRGAACSLLSSGTSSRSITSFLPSRFSSSASAAVSCPSSCFIALAILTTQLTIYPDGAALVSWPGMFFSIYKFCVRAEATNPNSPCEVSGVFALATFSIPRSQPFSSPF